MTSNIVRTWVLACTENNELADRNVSLPDLAHDYSAGYLMVAFWAPPTFHE